MPYIAKHKINGQEYFYLRKSVREGKKVKTKCIAYLGKTLKEAEVKKQEVLKKIKLQQSLKDLKGNNNFMREKINTEELASFAKRKGFVFRAGDIYGGLAGFWDFGPYGVELLNNIKKLARKNFVYQREDVVEQNGSIITNPKVWEASGHVETFNVNDILVVCKKCKKTNKVDAFEVEKVKCDCGGEYDWNKKQVVEQMFKVKVGLDNFSYLRPETCQSIFPNFKLIADITRKKLPFGIFQIGKSFRNEIAPRDFLFRVREFEQIELEYFFNPKKEFDLSKEHLDFILNFLSAENQEKGVDKIEKKKVKDLVKENKLIKLHAYWLVEFLTFFKSLGLSSENLRIREHMKNELSHYSKGTFDIDYNYPFGFKELCGVANRSNYDLQQHQKFSKSKLDFIDEETKERFFPHIIEPSFGVGRLFMALLCEAYNEDKSKDNVILKLNPKISPIKAAIFPLVKNDKELAKLSKEIYWDLREEWNIVYDESGSVGRRYARQDEIGTPFCITIDGDSIKNQDVTIRDRDSTKQIRIKVKDLKNVLRDLINNKIEFEKAGNLI